MNSLVLLKTLIICIKVLSSMLFFFLCGYVLLAGCNKSGIVFDFVITAILLRMVIVLL